MKLGNQDILTYIICPVQYYAIHTLVMVTSSYTEASLCWMAGLPVLGVVRRPGIPGNCRTFRK